MERTIPINWIDEDTNKVFWPNTLNVKNAFKRCQQPKKDWLKFEFVKIKVCGSEQFCDDCSDYTTTEEQICKRKSQKKSMKSPILPSFPSKTSTSNYASNNIVSSKVAHEQISLQENTPSKLRLLSNSSSGSDTSSNSCHSPSSNVFSISQSLSSSHPDSHFNLKESSLLCKQSKSSSNIRKSSQDASGNSSQRLNPAPPRRRDCKKFRRSDFPMNTADFQYTIIKLVTKVIDINQQNTSQQPTAHVVYEPLVQYQTFDDFIKFDNLLRVDEDVAKNLVDRLRKLGGI